MIAYLRLLSDKIMTVNVLKHLELLPSIKKTKEELLKDKSIFPELEGEEREKACLDLAKRMH